MNFSLHHWLAALTAALVIHIGGAWLLLDRGPAIPANGTAAAGAAVVVTTATSPGRTGGSGAAEPVAPAPAPAPAPAKMVQPSTSADTPSSGPTQALPVQPDAVLPTTPTPAQAKTAPAVPTTDAQPEASVAAQPVETKSGAASVRARATPSPESRHDEPERTTRSRPEERPTPQKSAPSRQPPSDSGTSATAPAEPSRSQAPQPEASSSTDAVGRSSRSAGEGTPGRSGQPSSSSSPPAARADALSTYVATVGQYLERHKEYPRQARLQLIEGRVSLRIVVAADGSVVSYRVDRSSGYGILDRAARRMVKRAAPLPPPPEELGRNDLQLIVPVSFRLR